MQASAPALAPAEFPLSLRRQTDSMEFFLFFFLPSLLPTRPTRPGLLLTKRTTKSIAKGGDQRERKKSPPRRAVLVVFVSVFCTAFHRWFSFLAQSRKGKTKRQPRLFATFVFRSRFNGFLRGREHHIAPLECLILPFNQSRRPQWRRRQR